jgi:asparagine synthase (glutamine-hydrolysing)
MCGITGIVSVGGGPVEPAVLQRMNDLQAHRGPDGEGFLLACIEAGSFQHAFVNKALQWHSGSTARVGLGHRRLAIIDLSERGAQPMSTVDGSTWIVFNGEIYNFQKLRSELEKEGYRFKSMTDTEVLLHAYLHWGEDCLDHLEGMYAFAIWDGRIGRLFCARDRLGIKPFYYAVPNGYFIFASEMKSLLAFPGLEPTPDDDAVFEFLVHTNCDYGERTMLRNVKALPAGHCLTLDLHTGELATKVYWQLEPRPDSRRTDSAQVEELRALLISTMHQHLISDVRAGSCLSGGVDSSTVVGLIGKIWNEEPEAARAIGDSFYTFTSCFEYGELDERDYALAVARHTRANPQLVFPTPEGFWSDFERLAWHQDMPFFSLAFYAQWHVMRAAQEAGVKVLLDGQGGDEVFGGYAKFRYAYLASLLRSGKVATAIRELGATLRQGDRYVLDIRNGHRYLPKKLRRLLKVDSLLKDALNTDFNRLVSGESTPATRWWHYVSGAQNGKGSWTAIQRIQIDDIVLDTLPSQLRFEDRSSMAFSIEARVPLLDHKLVEYGVALPDHLKVHNGWNKFAIRQAMQGLIPDAVRLRQKKLSFPSPDRFWLSRNLRPHVMELIHTDLRCQKYINTSVLRRWYDSKDSYSANTESYLGLFRLLSLEMWMRAFRIS